MTRARKPRGKSAPSLGPSNDDSPAVELEMRIAADIANGGGLLVPGDGDPYAHDDGGGDYFFALDDNAWAWDISRPIAEQLAETAADDAAADALVPAPVCDWHPEHGADDRPSGQRCDATATHRIVWLDGSHRFSYGCDAHLELDPAAPPVRIEKLGDESDGAP